jgi:hypothetical protein
LYALLPQDAILETLHATGTASQRQRRLPAHAVVWLVIAQAWFRDRCLAKVWRHLHPSPDRPEPVPSAFTQARHRLGARPLQRLFHRTCRPLSIPGVQGLFHHDWLVVALDGSVLEAPDTPANRRVFGAASNQHGPAAFPQLRLAALAEVGTHTITDVALGPYQASEQALSLRLLRRLPAVRRRKSHVLARVKAHQRDLPVEQVLPDGSYRSTIYPSSNAKRARRGGLPVRVIRYTHADPTRDGCGVEACLLTTVLGVALLPAPAAVRLYPWRWEEESVLTEIKGTLLQNRQPLLRSKTPTLVVQEVDGLLIGHYLVRRVMADAARAGGAAGPTVPLSFRHSLDVLEDRLKDPWTPHWLEQLRREVGWQRLRPKRPRTYPRVKKATRSRWPNKKPGAKPRRQPTQPLAAFIKILQTDGH